MTPGIAPTVQDLTGSWMASDILWEPPRGLVCLSQSLVKKAEGLKALSLMSFPAPHLAYWVLRCHMSVLEAPARSHNSLQCPVSQVIPPLSVYFSVICATE